MKIKSGTKGYNNLFQVMAAAIMAAILFNKVNFSIKWLALFD